MPGLYCEGRVYTTENMSDAATYYGQVARLQGEVVALAEYNFMAYDRPGSGLVPATSLWTQQAKAVELVTKLGAWCGLCDDIYTDLGATCADSPEELPQRYETAVVFAVDTWLRQGLLDHCEDLVEFMGIFYDDRKGMAELLLGGFTDGYVLHQELVDLS